MGVNLKNKYHFFNSRDILRLFCDRNVDDHYFMTTVVYKSAMVQDTAVNFCIILLIIGK